MNWASIIDDELIGIRERQAARLYAEHQRRAAAAQAVIDARIVTAREARIVAEQAHRRVRDLVEP